MKQKGFTLIETLAVLAIMGVLTGIIFAGFKTFKDAQTLDKDTETIVEVLREARTQTLSSKGDVAHGVHFESPVITLFSGAAYSFGATDNVRYTLMGTDTVLSLSLAGNGSDVVFNRLTGETFQNGTIGVSSPLGSSTKTITIYKTGLIEYN